MNIYEFEIIASCPNGESIGDRYDCRLETTRVIQAEKIAAMVRNYIGKPIYQEDLADEVFLYLQAKLRLTGTHHGVKITCVRE